MTALVSKPERIALMLGLPIEGQIDHVALAD